MIKNTKQLTARKKELRKLKDSLQAYKKELEVSDKDPDLKKLYYDSLLGQYEEIHAEIEEYEDLVDIDIASLEVHNIIDLPKGIIKFRIAAGLTQKELADKLMIKEQQIQRYEQEEYLKASFERIVQIIDALGINILVTNKNKEVTAKPDQQVWNKYSISSMEVERTTALMNNVRTEGLLTIQY